MSQKPLVILHGWSDHADSFIPLRTQLAQLLDLPIHTIILANYISLDDQVTFHDLASAMHQAWIDLKLPLSAQSVDMIVHSTGALICRHWLSQYFNANQTPIDHLLML